jgi:diguanylate cyclase
MFRADAGTGEQQSITSSAPPDEHRRSMVFADRAVTLIKALKLPASPRIYELCYAYATGEYPSLNIAINDLLTRRVAVGGDLIEQIGARYISPKDHREPFDKVGVRVSKVIGRVLGSLDNIIEDEEAFSADLAQTPDKLTTAENRNALVGEIRNMMQSAKFIDEQQRGLEEKLNVSIDEINDLRDQLQKIRNANMTDPLTGLLNRTSFERSLQKAIGAGAERKAPLWLALCDIDDFKKFNDAWGHQTGDQVLCLVGMEVRQKVGKSGSVARLGGAQFAAFMPDVPLPDVRALADAIRATVMSRDITIKSTNQRLGRVQVSFGIAGARTDDTSGSLVLRAQACLRTAKHQGRNRIVCDTDGEAPARELKVAFS